MKYPILFQKKKTVSNLSIVFAPSLLRKPEQNATNILDDSEKAHVLISTMIENFDKIFVVIFIFNLS